MAFCSSCGKQVPEGTKFCPYCGAALEVDEQPAQPNPGPTKTGIVGQLSEYININGPMPVGEEKVDAETNQIWGILAYILFFIPLIGAKDSKFARFHANNSLWLMIVGFGLGIVMGIFSFIPVLNVIFYIVGGLASLALTVLWVFGLIHAIKGLKKDLPLVGHIKLIK